MRNVNFLFPEVFEYKFGRKPKDWTLEQLHDLYLRAKSRAEKRWKVSNSIMDTIDKEIPKFDNQSVVYFYQIANDTTYLRQYEFTWKTKYRKYTSFGIRDPKLKTREERLDFALSNNRAFELGQQFYEAKKLEDVAWRSSWRVREILWHIIEEKLQKIYGETAVKETLLIEISGHKYFIHVDNGYGYARFSLQNEFDGEIVKLS